MPTELIFDLRSGDNKWEIAEKLKTAIKNHPHVCKAIRKQAHLSQKQLAYLLGCSQTTISEIERGIYSPSCDLAIDYLLVLSSNLPIDDCIQDIIGRPDADTFRNLSNFCQYSPRIEKLNHDRRKMVSVDLDKLTIALEGPVAEFGHPEFGQTCKWPDCGWTWYPDGLSDPHSGTCPLAD